MHMYLRWRKSIAHLEKLRPRAHGLWVLNNDTHSARARSIRDLDPISAESCFRRQIHAESGNGVSIGILDMKENTNKSTKVNIIIMARALVRVYIQKCFGSVCHIRSIVSTIQ